ncbi:MAG: hypothetical protein EHM70_15250 [Chloroflexota bacterium]|nr:MAG: hypothetical protein EHM70_15250 [Chloroflexota bacterium]
MAKKLIFLAILLVYVAPAPWGIALNYDTLECGGYWAGDEYYGYPLPDGWHDFYPDSNNLITTPVGTCTFEAGDMDSQSQNCCSQLGYTFVGEYIGEGQRYPSFLTYLVLAAVAIPTLIVVVCAGLILLVIAVALGGGGYWLWKRNRARAPKQEGTL